MELFGIFRSIPMEMCCPLTINVSIMKVNFFNNYVLRAFNPEGKVFE